MDGITEISIRAYLDHELTLESVEGLAEALNEWCQSWGYQCLRPEQVYQKVEREVSERIAICLN